MGLVIVSFGEPNKQPIDKANSQPPANTAILSEYVYTPNQEADLCVFYALNLVGFRLTIS